MDQQLTNHPNRDRQRIEICAQKCLRIADAGGIAHEHPADFV
jgi:hypothetical protein